MNVDKQKQAIARHLARIGWGAFFVWVGFCWLAPVEPGAALVGIGGITLVMQGLRALYGLPVEGFWLAAGVCFGLGGVAHLVTAEIPLMPVMLLVLGGLLLLGGLFGQLRHHQP